MRRHIIFAVNLLQDVNVVRPVAYLAAADFDVAIGFLITDAFVSRDKTKRWLAEVHIMAAELDAEIHVFGNVGTAIACLAGRQGVLIAGSESHLLAHAPIHELFRAAPPTFLRVTLQHGFECVGFVQNAEQTAVHGTDVRFAADVVCGWLEEDRLTEMAPSERPKLYVTGPQSVLQMSPPLTIDAPLPGGGGVVCENLHSVRFGVAPGRSDHFLREFESFATRLAREERIVTIRPHPGGQYIVKNNVRLPANVRLQNEPMFRVDLARFDYGVSAPSTVLLDLLLAGIPTAVWRDPDDLLDRSHYAALPSISGLDEWLAFARDASRDPASFRRRQADFLARLGMPVEPSEVRDRFARLLAGAGAPIPIGTSTPARVMLVADENDPEFETDVVQPLRDLRRSGRAELATLTGSFLADCFVDPSGREARQWAVDLLEGFQPTLLFFHRYSGPLGDALLDAAEAIGARTAYHLADDPAGLPLRNAPADISPTDRDTDAVRRYLSRVDQVHAATAALADAATAQGSAAPTLIGALGVHAEPTRPPVLQSRVTIGYAEFDGTADLAFVAPVIARALADHPLATAELLIRGPLPAVLHIHEDRVRLDDPIAEPRLFSSHLAKSGWSVALCPAVEDVLSPRKTLGRWLDYTAAGIPVVASRGPYEDMVDPSGWRLAGDEDEWVTALTMLIADPLDMFEQALAARVLFDRAGRFRDTVREIKRLLPDKRNVHFPAGTAIVTKIAPLRAEAERLSL